jgi:hypothetical protein
MTSLAPAARAASKSRGSTLPVIVTMGSASSPGVARTLAAICAPDVPGM